MTREWVVTLDVFGLLLQNDNFVVKERNGSITVSKQLILTG